jgi:hypothetical protein
MKKNTWKDIDKGTIEIDDVKGYDYPDFCDAFVSYAEYEDGTEVSEEDIIIWSEQNEETFSEMCLEEWI